jgi:catechol 2,3-dioxygenase-like lactoylglutathione lyase family enzyme
MAHKKKASGRPKKSDDVPQFFRLSVEVGNLEGGLEFYSRLLGLQGRKQPGSRCYFDCGPVTLSVLDVSSSGTPHPAAKALYFTPGGGIVVRPWGERSFYVVDPWKNPLCFVEEGTVYTG